MASPSACEPRIRRGGRNRRGAITTTITTDEGKVMFKTDETRDSADLGGKSGGYGYVTTIPLKDLPPAKYVLKVSAKSRLGQTPAAERDVRIEVAPPRQ